MREKCEKDPSYIELQALELNRAAMMLLHHIHAARRELNEQYTAPLIRSLGWNLVRLSFLRPPCCCPLSLPVLITKLLYTSSTAYAILWIFMKKSRDDGILAVSALM